MDNLINNLTALPWWGYILLIIIIVAIRDIFFNKKHTISHNYPVLGHFRYLLEKIGPEMRQYIVANNREELPFDRSQRSWIYASSKKQNNYQGFGTDQDIYAPGHVFINSNMIPYKVNETHPNFIDNSLLPCAKVMGLETGRKRPFRPYSIVNISAMSFGSLSAKAIESMNKGAKSCGCYHNTGEGGLSPYHRKGADIVFHIGTGYFGVRDDDGNFSMEKLVELVEKNPQIRAIEVKLSQGAKPGKGGVLPAKKITPEIAKIRNVPLGKDVLSPSNHSAFSTIEELVFFVEDIAQATGLPTGIKSAVGKLDQWKELAEIMEETDKGPDFITIDGGEGGTGAAPPAFADHVALPFVYAFSSVYQIFAGRELSDRITFIASGKLGFPANALMALAMGADVINVAREAMISIGCVQALSCHNNSCPTGIATQSKWLQAGIDVPLKAERFSNYIKTLRKEILDITHAVGYEHPCQMTMDDVDVSMGDNNFTKTLKIVHGYDKIPVRFNGMDSIKNCQYLGGDIQKASLEH